MAYKSQGIPASGARVITSRKWTFATTGLAKIVETWAINTVDIPTLVPLYGAPHITYPSLKVSQPVEGGEDETGSLTFLTVIYEGYNNGAGGDISTLGPVYEWQGAMDAAPIETHPEYDATVAYNQGLGFEPLDSMGRFVDFPKGSVRDGRSVEGVRSFPSSGGTWTKRWIQSGRPVAMTGVGYVGTPPGTPPSFDDDRDWLVGPLTYREAGGVFECSQTWILSGPGGHSGFLVP